MSKTSPELEPAPKKCVNSVRRAPIRTDVTKCEYLEGEEDFPEGIRQERTTNTRRVLATAMYMGPEVRSTRDKLMDVLN